jgi:hypothetical protein
MQQAGCEVATSWRGDHDHGEHGEAVVGQHWPRERAHWGEGCQDTIMVQPWALGRSFSS